MESCISFKNVTKVFKVYEEKPSTLKEFVTKIRRIKYKKNEVLDDISFDIYKGETVGIIGNNGIGKSTILKLISKIIYPDSGNIKVNGKVTSLLELGAGFYDEFTGRQNIYFNASIFGMKKSQIDKVIDDIIEFSELQDYIDFPLRTYSSGMYMRLAFSVAMSVNADVIIIDEVLAVGDVEFKKKCMNKIFDLKNKGKTILLVSHDMEIVEKLCDRTIWLEDKKIKMDGSPDLVIKKYLESGENK